MTTSPRQIKRNYLQAQIDTGLTPFQCAIDDAQEELDNYLEDNPQRQPMSPTEREALRLRGAVEHAKRELYDAQRDLQKATQGIERLDAMLCADSRITQTGDAIAPATAAVATARHELTDAQRVLNEVTALLDTERAAHDLKATQTADDLLNAIRTGKPPSVKTTNTAMLTALTTAHQVAQATVTTANASVDYLQGVLEDCKQAHREALTGATARDLADHAQAYAQAVVAHRDACHAARLHCHEPDVGQLIVMASREVSEAADELDNVEREVDQEESLHLA